jgi:hypothetical protein
LRGYAKHQIPEKIRAAGGEIFAVTSEPQALASSAQRDWEIGFDSIGDPHHEISHTCRERGWLELFVNEKLQFLDQSGDWKPQHPKGYFQPGVLALSTAGRVLYRWRSTPSRKNIGGATERPTAEHVWSAVSAALIDPPGASDAQLDEKPRLDSRAIPWPIFVALLVANGWFVSARGFPHLTHGAPPTRRILFALLRILLFAMTWTAAFATLPAVWVGVLFVSWAAWITPRIRFIQREFQSEPGH